MKWLRNSSFCSLNLIKPIIMSPHSERHHSLYYPTINYSQQEYLKLELPILRWMYATKATIYFFWEFQFLLTKHVKSLMMRTKQTPNRNVKKDESRKHQYFLKWEKIFILEQLIVFLLLFLSRNETTDAIFDQFICHFI